MSIASQVAAFVLLLVWTCLAIEAMRGRRGLPRLMHPRPRGRRPRVSVIVPARNEAAMLPRSLPSLLAQTYPDLEIIVLDDRSMDSTPALLAAFRSPRLQVVRIDSLPPGWLGKTHALHVGSRRARGEWLLFTDADVVFQPGCLEAAIAYAEERGADHLVLIPHTETVGFWETTIIGAFSLLFGLALRPWRAARPRSGAFIGIGAFNLIRRTAYEQVGTHEALAMAVVDDLELGRLVKRAGLRQAVARGDAWLSVRWQIGLRGVIEGLEKNAFAALGYSLPRVGLACLALAGLFLAPWAALALGQSGLWAAAALLPLAVQVVHARDAGLPLWSALGQPAAIVVLLYAIVRSAILARLRGHVFWRGTAYPLSELRPAKMSVFPIRVDIRDSSR